MEIKIDDREIWTTIETVKDLAIEKGFVISKERLDVGDVIFADICIERKDAVDFVSSLYDGRLREQAQKMKVHYKHNYIIIQGDIFNTQSNINPRSLIGMMVSLSARYGIKIIPVNDVQGFAWAVYAICTKHTDGKIPIETKVVKLPKHHIHEDIVINILTCIPGVGKDKALDIALHFNFKIHSIFSANTEDLARIKGIGKNIAENIYKTLHR